VVNHLDRRSFLLAALAPAFCLEGAARAQAERLRVTDLEVHQVLPPLQAYNARTLLRAMGTDGQARGIYVLKAGGLEGYGETWGLAPARDRLAPYVGKDVFECIAQADSMPVNMAALDLLGKHLGVPVWKLLGRKMRSWAPVSAWTISQPPAAMAEEVRQAAKAGHRWLKYHVSMLQNAVAQTAAMAKAAPEGFRVHYDFNADSNADAVYPVLRDLEPFAVAGCIEDPIAIAEHEAWRVLRGKCRLPILFHHNPEPTEAALLAKVCDGFVASRWPTSITRRLAALAESTNTPFVLQLPGGALSQAFMAQQAAVFKMASLPSVTVSNLWTDDVTVESFPVVGGSIEVTDRPGLGVTLDREKLGRFARVPRPQHGRFLVRVRYAGGPTLWFRHDPDGRRTSLSLSRETAGADFPGPVPAYGNPVVTDFWDEEGSAEFDEIWRRTEHGPAWSKEAK
jgi:L-alanine-DL-glutamate epimerase-like enolase superfamily enzyme